MKRDFWGIDGEIWGWNSYIISSFHSLHPPPQIQTGIIITIFNAQKRFLKKSPHDVQTKGGGGQSLLNNVKKKLPFSLMTASLKKHLFSPLIISF